MFVGDEVRLDVGFAVARERLTRLGESGALSETSQDAYGPGLTRVGVAGFAKLVRVQVRELSWTDLTAGLAPRPAARAAGCSRCWTLTSSSLPTGMGARC